MLKNISSQKIIQTIFLNINELIKLKIVKYNNRLKSQINIDIINCKFYSGKYLKYETNGI